MKIGVDTFQARFVRQAPQQLKDPLLQEVADRVDFGSSKAVAAAFDQMVLAVGLSSLGVPGLAALSQDVARALITPQQEQQLADTLHDVFESRFAPNHPLLEETWQGVQRVTGSAFPAPQQVNSPLVYAQADSRNLYIGQSALATDLADPNVLTFTLAHEEAHRQHRDSAGAKGLEALQESSSSPAAFQALREGRHHNERQADEFGARVAAKLGCEPLPILKFLLEIPEDAEHPAGRERAALVRQAMAEEGVQVTPQQWSELVVPDPRGDVRFTDSGTFHADPASWQPLHVTQLSELRERRLDYLRQHNAPGSLVVLDQFFQPAGTDLTHGRMVSATARGAGFTGPLLELDTTYSLQPETAGKLEQMAAVQQTFERATDPQQIRDSLRELSVLKRSYSLERSAESLEQLKEAGLRDSAVNLSLGHNAADESRRLLERSLTDHKLLLQLVRGFCDDPQDLGPTGRAAMVGRLTQWLQDTTLDPRWQASKQRYNEAVEGLSVNRNSVVVAAGNEGETPAFLQAWCSGQVPSLPSGFENNDLSNSKVTVVGASQGGERAAYTSRDGEIDVYADGTSLLGDEQGTSFAAPRVAAQLAEAGSRRS